jgi:hypothetical protein
VPRFTKQYDSYTCGPAAVINALKWAGEQVSYRATKKSLCARMKCWSDGGTRPSDLDTSLRKIGKKRFSVSRRDKFSISSLEKHLRKDDCSIVVRYIWPDTEHVGHYVFISHYNHRLFGGMYYVTNLYCDGPAGRYITRKTFKNLISKRSKAVVWFLIK